MKQVLVNLLTALLVVPFYTATAFVGPSSQAVTERSSFSVLAASRGGASKVPTFDIEQNKWVVTSEEQGPEYGYDIWGSLLRQGPNPVIQRIFRADEYEQAILKFMNGDKVDRMTAQAEMDAYLRNPNDWAYNRQKGYNVDYLKIDSKKIALTLVWSAIVIAVAGRGVYCLQSGDNYWAVFGLTSKAAWCEADNSCLLK